MRAIQNNDTHLSIEHELELYRDIIAAIPYPICILDRDKIFRRIYNTPDEKKEKYSLQSLIGCSLLSVVNDRENILNESFVHLNNAIDSVLKRKTTEVYRYIAHEMHFEVTVSLIGKNYIMSQMRNVSEEVTHQIEIEREIKHELSFALTAGGLTSWSYDVEKQEIFSSHDNSIIGERVKIEKCFERVIPQHRHRLASVYSRIIEKGEKHSEARLCVKDLSGQTVWVDIHAMPQHFTADGKVSYIVGSQKDVTDIVLQEQIRQELVRQNTIVKDNANAGFAYITPDYKVSWENIKRIFPPDFDDRTYYIEAGELCYKNEDKLPDIAIREIVEACFSGEGIQKTQKLLKNKLFVEITAIPAKDDDGNICGVVLKVEDITSYKEYLSKIEQSELQVKSSNQLLMTIFESMPCSLFIKDADDDYRFVFANKLYHKQWGFASEEVIGKTDYELFSKEDADKFREVDERVIKTKMQEVIIENSHDKTGETKIWQTTKIHLFEEDKSKNLLIGIAIDITQRDVAQKQLEYANMLMELTFVAGGIFPWELDLERNTLQFRNKNEIFQGVSDVSLSHYINSCVHPDCIDIFNSALDPIRSNKATGLDCKYLSKYGDTYEWVHVVGQRIEDPITRDVKALGISRVITEDVQKQSELEEAKRRAEESDALKTAFLANISHEIRTPLNAVVGFSQLLSDADDIERDAYIDIIDNNSNLLLQLISDILDLSKIESGDFSYESMEFDLTTIFCDLESSMNRKLKPGVELINKSKDKSCFVSIDRVKVVQIITNYLTNAIKFTDKGFIEIGYDVVEGGVKLYVKDTGCGISEENLPKVFDRFEKFNRFEQGTGLGTSICKAITEAYGGEVGATSKIGEGSLFWAYLPLIVKTTEA